MDNVGTEGHIDWGGAVGAEMTDKTDEDIDDVLVKLAYKHKLQNELTYEKGTYCVDYPTFNYAHLFKDIKQLCIESDEAREYWREHDTEEPNVLLATHIKRLKTEKKRFIDQVCEAVLVLFKDNGLQKDIYYTDIEQAIRSGIEGEK